MLDKIQEKIGNKVLSVWCVVDLIEYDMLDSCDLWLHTIIEVNKYWDLIVHEQISWEYRECSNDINVLSDENWSIEWLYIQKIIWRPVNLWDIFERFVHNGIYIYWEYSDWWYAEIDPIHIELIQLLNIYKMKDKPLDLQCDDCIKKLYNMLF